MTMVMVTEQVLSVALNHRQGRIHTYPCTPGFFFSKDFHSNELKLSALLAKPAEGHLPARFQEGSVDLPRTPLVSCRFVA